MIFSVSPPLLPFRDFANFVPFGGFATNQCNAGFVRSQGEHMFAWLLSLIDSQNLSVWAIDFVSDRFA